MVKVSEFRNVLNKKKRHNKMYYMTAKSLLLRFVSRFTVHLCNAIYFSTIFSTPCKRFTKNLYFGFLDLNMAYIRDPIHFPPYSVHVAVQ